MEKEKRASESSKTKKKKKCIFSAHTQQSAIAPAFHLIEAPDISNVDLFICIYIQQHLEIRREKGGNRDDLIDLIKLLLMSL